MQSWLHFRDAKGLGHYPRGLVQAIRDSGALSVVLSSTTSDSPHVSREVERAISYSIPVFVFRTEPIQPTQDLEYLISISQWYDGFPTPADHTEGFAHHVIAGIQPTYAPFSTTEQEQLHRLLQDLENTQQHQPPPSPIPSLQQIAATKDTETLRTIAVFARRQHRAQLIPSLARLDAFLRAERWPLGLARLSLVVGRKQGQLVFDFHASVDGNYQTHNVPLDRAGNGTLSTLGGGQLTISVQPRSFHIQLSAPPNSSLRARRFSIWNGLRLLKTRLAAVATGHLGPRPPGHLVFLEQHMELPQ